MNRITLAGFLSFLAALLAAGAVALHLVGMIRHGAYLGYWGIDPGLFPKSTDYLVINGYYGLVERFFAILSLIFGKWIWFVASGLVIGIYIAGLNFAANGSAKPPGWWLRAEPWVRQVLRTIGLTVGVFALFPFGLFLLTTFMVVPAILGDQAGISAAEQVAAEFKKGCAESRYMCVTLKKNKEILATGFVIDDSPAQIAIFDTDLQKARTVPRADVEMSVNRAPPLLKKP